VTIKLCGHKEISFVNQPVLEKNERVILQGVSPFGKMYINFVGGNLVGSIHVKRNNEFREYMPVAKKGHPLLFIPHAGDALFNQTEELGHFEFGSNVVLLFEVPKNFKLEVKPGDVLKYGQAIGRVVPTE